MLHHHIPTVDLLMDLLHLDIRAGIKKKDVRSSETSENRDENLSVPSQMESANRDKC